MQPAPELDVLSWVNTDHPLLLSELRGKVVVIHAFQMLCPGCVAHGIPQASALMEYYRHDDVQVIGLHSVFEHHSVMNIEALEVFIHEYRLVFPIAVDRPSESGPIPNSMRLFNMQGTPTLIVIDQSGFIRLNHFGRLGDMQVGNLIGGLLAEGNTADTPQQPGSSTKGQKGCDDEGCSI